MSDSNFGIASQTHGASQKDTSALRWVCLVWMLIGAARLMQLRAASPERVTRMNEAFVQGESAEIVIDANEDMK